MSTIFRVLFFAFAVLCLGVSADAATAPDPSVVGRWSSVPNLPFFPVHVIVLPTGKVMIWPGDGTSGNDPRLWDPATQAVTPLAKSGYDLFCSGHSFMKDGRLFVAGGHIATEVGLPNASIYDPFNDTWTAVPNMNAGRWYPTNTTLANGDVLVIAGSADGTIGMNPLPQVFQTGTWRNLTNAQLTLDMYPRMHLAPNGKVFNTSPSTVTRYLDTSGTGAWTVVANRSLYRDYGSSVMYDDGKILIMGGGDPPAETAEVIDLNSASPAWRAVAPMAIGRRQLNATILPDGKVLVTGGTNGPGFNNATTPVYAAEMWDPATETWSTMASAQIPRLYHSAVVLLPDGRLLSTGGNGYTQPEIYEPPYLFKGARPTISSLPSNVIYGQTFFVQTPDASSITKVHLIRLSSVTHAFNMDQRLNRLSFSQAAGGLNVVAPGSSNLAPPGYYLLFILTSSGVPSIGQIVQLTSTDPTLTALSPPSATAGGAAFTLTVNGSNFVSGSVVQWNGAARPTTYVNSTQLTSQISASDITVAGTAQVSVLNPVSAGGGATSAATFTIIFAPCPIGQYLAEYYNNDFGATPVFTACEASIDHNWGYGGPGNGVNNDYFFARWTGRFNFTADNYTFTATTDDGMRVWVDSGLVINAWVDQGPTTYQGILNLTQGEHLVQVEYFEGSGGAVAQLNWQAANPVPVVTTLSPSSATAGGGAFTLTVNGGNLVSGSVVQWNGAARTTTYVNSTQLTAQIPASDIAVAGTAQVSVLNPASAGGGTTNAVTFTIISDTTPPNTNITAAPASPSNSGSASFSFTSTEAGSTYQCQLDGAAFAACASPQNYSGLTNGSHTFQARAIDLAGNIDATPASYTWTIDVSPPTVTITVPTLSPTYTTGVSPLSLGGTASDNNAVTQVTWSNDRGGSGAASGTANWTINGIVLQSGSNVLTVTARDAAGNIGPAALTVTYTGTPPPDTTPPDTSITGSPTNPSSSGSASFSFTSTEAGSSFQCQLDGAAFAACASPQNYSGLANGSHTFQVRAIDLAGNIDPTPASYTWTINTTVVVPGLVAAYGFEEGSGTSVADSSGNNHTGTLVNGPTWTTGEYGSALSFDGVDDYVLIANPGSFNFGTADFTMMAWVKRKVTGSYHTILSKTADTAWQNGGKEFYIDFGGRLTFDAWGIGDFVSNNTINDLNWHHVAVTFVDSSDTMALYIDGVLDKSGTLNLGADVSGHIVKLGKFPNGEFLNGSLDEFRIYNRALSQTEIQNDMNTPVGVDTYPPDTSITSTPSNSSNSSNGSFNFTSTEAGSFECQLDGGGFVACTNPRSYTGLGNGSHTFQVRAIDAAGNIDPTPASYTWTIDVTPPTVSITSPTTLPIFSTDISPLTLGGTASDNNAVTQVTWSNDRGGSGTASGTASWTASGIFLLNGTNVLTVTARDAAGNTGTATLTVNYTDTTAPDTSITATPTNLSNSSSASFSFTSNEAGTSYQCQLDGGGFVACTNPRSYTGLGNGSHTFQVRAIDAAGNIDPTPASYTWTIDTTPPDTSITGSPSNPSSSASASFSFTSTEAGSSFQCQLDGSAFAACSSPQNYSGLSSGSHTFQVRAIDLTGNIDPTPASYTWTYTPVTRFPNGTAIETGTLANGTAASLNADDNNYYQVNSTTSGTRTTSWYGIFNSVAKNLSNLKVSYKGKNSVSCTQIVAIWRWTDSTWVQLDSRAVSTSEINIADLVPPGTLGNYVSGATASGDLRVRVRCTRSGNFTASGDLMKIVYDTP